MSRVNNEVILKDLLVATRGATKAWETLHSALIETRIFIQDYLTAEITSYLENRSRK